MKSSNVGGRWLIARLQAVTGIVRVRVAVGVLGLRLETFQPCDELLIEPYACGAQDDEQSPDDGPIFDPDAVAVMEDNRVNGD